MNRIKQKDLFSILETEITRVSYVLHAGDDLEFENKITIKAKSFTFNKLKSLILKLINPYYSYGKCRFPLEIFAV